ncbi:unnamed protein product [Phytomonas sp. EM1]|nr:unnamed protein product [Phytomonas sp. EM1]|eukprot:CCW63452.1 unnamed protein product [Phytomonas sp. isolate EM1]
MDDYRFPLYYYFPEGTVLFDPSYIPPMRVPLGTASQNLGVTLRKLLPFGSYEAYYEDSTTGALHLKSMKYVCLYVDNLPDSTTPEVLGRFFETFDLVKEANVFRGWDGRCNGRGWVMFEDPSKLLLVPRVLEFFAGRIIYTALSDREPTPTRRHPLITPPPREKATPPAAERFVALPEAPKRPLNSNLPLPRSRSSAVTPPSPSNPQGDASAPTRAKAPEAVGKASYLILRLSEAEAEVAVRENELWIPPEMALKLHRLGPKGGIGSVFVFVLLYNRMLFGCARFCTPLPSLSEVKSPYPITWIHKCLFLHENVLDKVGGQALLRLADGSFVKPVLALALFELLDAQKVRKGQPSPVYPLNTAGGWFAARGRRGGEGGFGVDGRGRGGRRGRGFLHDPFPVQAVPEPRSGRRRTQLESGDADVGGAPAVPSPKGGSSIPSPASQRAQVASIPRNTEAALGSPIGLSGGSPGEASLGRPNSFYEGSKLYKRKKDARTRQAS